MLRFPSLRAATPRIAAALLLAAAGAALLAPRAAAEPQPLEPIKHYSEVLKGFERIDGYFPLFKRGEQMFLHIPKDRMERLFLIAISLAGGPQFAGFQLDDWALKWERLENKLLLVRPNLLHKAADGNPLNDVVERTFTSSVIYSAKIEAHDGDGGWILDATPLFKNDFADLSGLAQALGGGSGYSLNSEISRWAVVKGFPHNTEIAVDAVFSGKGGGSSGEVADGRGVRLRVHYSLSELPRTSYKTRAADDRVDYFMTAIKDYGRGHDDRTLFERLIHRWNLEKLDANLEMSPPKKPIVFYIEKTVPVRFRRYIREGIEEWNRAFEKVGFVDAVVTRQQTDDNEFKNLDPEDVRYNFVRWITSGNAFAMGPSRVNPTTGEILDADVIIDDSFSRLMLAEHTRYGRNALALLADPKLDALVRVRPDLAIFEEFGAPRLDARLGDAAAPEAAAARATEDRREQMIREFLERRGRDTCSMANGLAQQAAFARTLEWVRRDAGGKVSEEFIGQFLKELVMHEVGHTMGLRHNFKASSTVALSKINSAEKPTQLSGSVMDYNAVNYAPKGQTQGCYQMLSLGAYDLWAIEYGYRVPAGNQDEKGMLKAIAARAAEKELAYATDEDTSLMDPDPTAQRWDLADDPIEFARARAALVDEVMKEVLTRLVPEGQDYFLARQAFDTLLSEYYRNAVIVARQVGGQYVSRDHRADPSGRPPLTLVPVARQREALKYLTEAVFSDTAFKFPTDLLNYLGPGHWGHWDSDEYDSRLDYPVHARMVGYMSAGLRLLLNPWTVERIHDAELKVSPDQDAMTLAELFATLRGAVWTELESPKGAGAAGPYTARKPLISSLRRALQREHLRIMIGLATGSTGASDYPADARTLAWYNLQDLQDRLAKVMAKSEGLDDYTRAHLAETEERVEQALRARYERR
ncbi:MAG: zinc-dependent metalloprotease [Planctomycetes bacterium]|nr:zinc-dependent metalloprotease [Planctomycetota bacterium]